MTLDLFFTVLVPMFLVLVVYGQVGSRRRGLGPRARTVAAALRVVLLPATVALALWSAGPRLLGYGGVVAGMVVAGVILALLVELVAPRLGA